MDVDGYYRSKLKVMAVKVFCCYAREAEAMLSKLRTQLKTLEKRGLKNPGDYSISGASSLLAPEME
jgi:hypothetical protein